MYGPWGSPKVVSVTHARISPPLVFLWIYFVIVKILVFQESRSFCYDTGSDIDSETEKEEYKKTPFGESLLLIIIIILSLSSMFSAWVMDIQVLYKSPAQPTDHLNVLFWNFVYFVCGWLFWIWRRSSGWSLFLCWWIDQLLRLCQHTIDRVRRFRCSLVRWRRWFSSKYNERILFQTL